MFDIMDEISGLEVETFEVVELDTLAEDMGNCSTTSSACSTTSTCSCSTSSCCGCTSSSCSSTSSCG